MLLECCFTADADFLIASDKDLLAIEKAELKTIIPRLRIVLPRAFLEI